MITTIAKPFRAAKKKEWNIYQNAGAQHDAERFSLIDPVLDGELNDEVLKKDKTNVFEKHNLFAQIAKWFRTKLFRYTYRTLLVFWFGLYCGGFILLKLTGKA